MKLIRRPDVLSVFACLMVLQGCASTPTTSSEAMAETELRDSDLDVLFATEFPVADKAEAMQRAGAAWQSGDTERALFFYVKALQYDPDDADLLSVIGTIHRREENAVLAVRAYTLALRSDPDHSPSLEGRGLILLSNEEDELARADLERAVAVDPEAWQAYNGLGLLADRRGDHAKALHYYDVALAIRPDAAVVLNNRGYSKFLSNDYDDAMRDLYVAAKDYGYRQAWMNLAAVYSKVGWYEDAIETYGQLLDHAEALQMTANAAVENGDYEVGEKLLQRAIEASPKYFPAAEESLAELRSRGR